jgi:hypothetical protein
VKAIAASLVAIAATLLLAPVASAQLGAAAGAERKWIRVEEGADYEEFKSPLVGITYDVPMDEEGYWGLSFGYRGAQDGILISQYLMEAWSVGSVLEWFGGGQLETWTRTGAGTEFLGGIRAGVRFAPLETENTTFEVSGNWSGGENGIRTAGVMFGLRIVATPGEDT